MRARSITALLLTGLASMGCANEPLLLKGTFDAAGEVSSPAHSGSPATASADVRVFYDSAPERFSLEDNELKVEPDFHHQILGIVKVKYKEGYCGALDAFGEKPREKLLEVLKQRAWEAGASAVVYVATPISADDDKDHFTKLCLNRARGAGLADFNFATGRAVVLAP